MIPVWRAGAHESDRRGGVSRVTRAASLVGVMEDATAARGFASCEALMGNRSNARDEIFRFAEAGAGNASTLIIGQRDMLAYYLF
jgi:hypothetical protein